MSLLQHTCNDSVVLSNDLHYFQLLMFLRYVSWYVGWQEGE